MNECMGVCMYMYACPNIIITLAGTTLAGLRKGTVSELLPTTLDSGSLHQLASTPIITH